MPNYLCFDLETDGLFDGDAPPTILCAATTLMKGSDTTAGDYEIVDSRHWEGGESGMSIEQVEDMINYMVSANKISGLDNIRCLGWNSVGFDFKVMYHTTSSIELKNAILALVESSVDPMFNFFMAKGFPVSLNATAKAMTPSYIKSVPGMSWTLGNGGATGRFEILQYCKRDVNVVATVVSAIEGKGKLEWWTKGGHGRPSRKAVWQPLASYTLSMPLCEAMHQPEPDNTWMGEDRPKIDNFVGWIKKARQSPTIDVHNDEIIQLRL